MKKPRLITSLFYGLTFAALGLPSSALAEDGHGDHERSGNGHESDNFQNENGDHHKNDNNDENNNEGNGSPVSTPEPATLTLLGAGLVSLAAKFRSRNRQ